MHCVIQSKDGSILVNEGEPILVIPLSEIFLVSLEDDGEEMEIVFLQKTDLGNEASASVNE